MPFQVLQGLDRGLGHKIRRRAGEEGDDFDFFEFLGVGFLHQIIEGQAGGLGVGEAEREVDGFGDRETPGLVTHGEVADIGRPGNHPVKDVLGREQGAAREGLDGHFPGGPLFHFGLPALHLDAGEGGGGREVGVGQFDLGLGRVAEQSDSQQQSNGQGRDDENRYRLVLFFHGRCSSFIG